MSGVLFEGEIHVMYVFFIFPIYLNFNIYHFQLQWNQMYVSIHFWKIIDLFESIYIYDIYIPWNIIGPSS